MYGPLYGYFQVHGIPSYVQKPARLNCVVCEQSVVFSVEQNCCFISLAADRVLCLLASKFQWDYELGLYE